MNLSMTMVFCKTEGGYIGYVEELPGANSQGDTLEKTRLNLLEAISLVLESNKLFTKNNLISKKIQKESLQFTSL